jgi:pimeloyl-ACP methyl ester carboxylesterase
MPYANNNGVNIYYEVEGQGPPLVIAHGLNGNLNGWPQGVSELKHYYQLILFDARGHGKSDKPHERSAYGINMVKDVVTVLDDVKVERAHYLGYSMGGRIGFRLALYYADRFKSFILGGASPFRSDAEVAVENGLLEGMRILLADPAAFLVRMEGMFHRPLTPVEKDTFLNNDAKALIALVTSLQEMPALTEQELSVINKPCLVYCGESDPRFAGAKKSTEYIPNARFVPLPGDHGVHLMRTDLIVPMVKEFLIQVSKFKIDKRAKK